MVSFVISITETNTISDLYLICKHPPRVFIRFLVSARISKINKIIMDQYRSNHPNAAKLIFSLRNTGYDSYAAVEDIIDNSIDAQARSIKVVVEHDKRDLRITIADNGHGMSEAILDEALKLGSITDKEEISDLGKFGMGLCTASISMARKLEVITQEKGSGCLYSSQDLDEIIKRNEFIKVLRRADKAEAQLFNELAGKQGTIVILSSVDRLSDTNTAQFASKLSRDIGRIYRKFIEAGIEFSVNGKKIEMIDPLVLSNKNTKIYSDEVYDLPETATAGKKNQKIRVMLVLLPESSQEEAKLNGWNIRNQGFYVMRNNREIASGEALDIFSKHNDFNRLRMEISFNAVLDNEMGVRFSKDGVKPNQGITDFLKQEIGGQISSIRSIMLKNKRADKESQVDHASSEAVIAQRAKLLITPEVQVEKRAPRTNLRGEEQKPPRDTKERENFRQTRTSPKGLGARFEAAAMGREGTLYETYQEGKVIVIRWNTDHPFYDRVILVNKDSKDIVSAIDYLIFALASAELKNSNDDNIELMANLKSVMSTNLRALLS